MQNGKFASAAHPISRPKADYGFRKVVVPSTPNSRLGRKQPAAFVCTRPAVSDKAFAHQAEPNFIAADIIERLSSKGKASLTASRVASKPVNARTSRVFRPQKLWRAAAEICCVTCLEDGGPYWIKEICNFNELA